jgi:trk system potassium uptake protein TrkA
MKSVVVDTIIARLMGEGVMGMHRLGEGSVGIVEVEVAARAAIVDKPITAFKLPGGSLVLLARRGDNAFIPRGDYVFSAGDKVVLIAKNGSEKEIDKYFGSPDE